MTEAQSERAENPVTVRLVGNIGLVVLSRPPVNALSNATLATFVEALRACAADDEVAVIVVHGENGVFTAGGDNKEFATFTEADGEQRVRLGHEMMLAVLEADKPVVCSVTGAAVGGGCELCACADHVVAAPTARFGMPEIKNGVLPMALGMRQLSSLLGRRPASHLLYTGELIDAKQALDLGLVSEVVPPDAVLTRALEWAETLAIRPRPLVRAIRRAIYGLDEVPLERLEQWTVEDFHTYFGTPEVVQDLARFVSKSNQTT